jgi:hypothetical protein
MIVLNISRFLLSLATVRSAREYSFSNKLIGPIWIRISRAWAPESEGCVVSMRAILGRYEVRFLEMPPLPRLNSAASALGQYCNCEIAAKTLVAVLTETSAEPLITRDTVAVETPANLATSLMVQGIGFGPVSVFLS